MLQSFHDGHGKWRQRDSGEMWVRNVSSWANLEIWTSFSFVASHVLRLRTTRGKQSTTFCMDKAGLWYDVIDSTVNWRWSTSSFGYLVFPADNLANANRYGQIQVALMSFSVVPTRTTLPLFHVGLWWRSTSACVHPWILNHSLFICCFLILLHCTSVCSPDRTAWNQMPGFSCTPFLRHGNLWKHSTGCRCDPKPQTMPLILHHRHKFFLIVFSFLRLFVWYCFEIVVFFYSATTRPGTFNNCCKWRQRSLSSRKGYTGGRVHTAGQPSSLLPPGSGRLGAARAARPAPAQPPGTAVGARGLLPGSSGYQATWVISCPRPCSHGFVWLVVFHRVRLISLHACVVVWSVAKIARMRRKKYGVWFTLRGKVGRSNRCRS